MWILVKDKLPEEGKYVFARHNRGTWNDTDDQENVNCVVVKLIKGISQKERNKLDVNSKRYKTYSIGDEWGNNLVPYSWKEFGSDEFFGQSITHWMKIPPLNI